MRADWPREQQYIDQWILQEANRIFQERHNLRGVAEDPECLRAAYGKAGEVWRGAWATEGWDVNAAQLRHGWPAGLRATVLRGEHDFITKSGVAAYLDGRMPPPPPPPPPPPHGPDGTCQRCALTWPGRRLGRRDRRSGVRRAARAVAHGAPGGLRQLPPRAARRAAPRRCRVGRARVSGLRYVAGAAAGADARGCARARELLEWSSEAEGSRQGRSGTLCAIQGPGLDAGGARRLADRER